MGIFKFLKKEGGLKFPEKKELDIPPAPPIKEVLPSFSEEDVMTIKEAVEKSRPKILEPPKRIINVEIYKNKYTFHSLRHGWATRMLENGTPINIVSLGLGHANIATTSIYLKASPQDLLKSYEEKFWKWEEEKQKDIQ